jgi:hypothetical protein
VIYAGAVSAATAAVPLTPAKNEVQTLTITAGTQSDTPAGDKVTVTLATDGVAATKTVTTGVVNVTSVSAVAAAIKTAIEADPTVKDLYTVAVDAVTNVVTLTAKGTIAGTNIAEATTAFVSGGTGGTAPVAVLTTTAGAPEVPGTAAGTATVDTLTGDAGADKFVVDGTGATDKALTAASTIITDFTTGVDKLVLGTAADATAGTGNYLEATSVATSLSALLDAADAAAKAFYVGQVGSDSYVVVQADTASVDTYANIIKLTGVALDGIAATDILATV